MKTGMIIVHYNDFESVSNLINNTKDYKILDEIIIYDNNSTKEVKKELSKLTTNKIKLIDSKLNKGYSYAINEGSKQLINDLGECNIIVSNSDVIIEKEKDIVELIKLLDKKEIGLVAPTIIEKGNLNRGWKNPTPIQDSLLNLVYINRFLRKKYLFYKEDHYKKDISKVDVASGCFFIIKSDTLKSINYLDDNIFLYYEENILAKKLQVKKKQVIISNNIKIIHNHSVSIDKNINKLKKLKEQKKSQYYFQTEYNDANALEELLLKTTAFLSRIILAVVYTIKDITH